MISKRINSKQKRRRLKRKELKIIIKNMKKEMRLISINTNLKIVSAIEMKESMNTNMMKKMSPINKEKMP